VGIARRVLEERITIASSTALALVIFVSFVPVSNAGSLSGGKFSDQGSRAMVGKPCTSANGKIGVSTLVCRRKVPWGPASTCLQWTIVCH